MYGETQKRMQCAEFEALLAEALDHTLNAAEQERFDGHRAACAVCGPLFAEAELGHRWLAALKRLEVEPPARLMENILRATIGAVQPEPARVAGLPGWWGRLRESMPRVFAPALQPRFAMSFAMAFFSVTMLLNIIGVKLSDVKRLDLRPSAIVRTYYETQGKLVKYYENIRVVYEIESRVQQLKRAATPEEPSRQEKQPERKDQSGEPDRKNQNYSHDESQVIVAFGCAEARAISPRTPDSARELEGNRDREYNFSTARRMS